MRCDSRIQNANDVVNLAFGYGEIKKFLGRTKRCFSFFSLTIPRIINGIDLRKQGSHKIGPKQKVLIGSLYFHILRAFGQFGGTIT